MVRFLLRLGVRQRPARASSNSTNIVHKLKRPLVPKTHQRAVVGRFKRPVGRGIRLCAVNDNKVNFPVSLRYRSSNENNFEKDLPLFKQLASDLESLDKALVKIHESRKATVGKVDESLLTTLIEEVQREQEAWFKQVQLMEKLMEQTANLESKQSEVEKLRGEYEEMRRKVDLYYGLLEERNREMDTLKQQLEDVNAAVELKERKHEALRELVVAGTSTAQEEMGVPTWKPEDVSTFFVKKEKAEEKKQDESAAKVPPSFDKNYEVPGLAFVSILLIVSRLSGKVYSSTMRHLPKEIKAMVEIVGLVLILLTAASIGTTGLL